MPARFEANQTLAFPHRDHRCEPVMYLLSFVEAQFSIAQAISTRGASSKSVRFAGLAQGLQALENVAVSYANRFPDPLVVVNSSLLSAEIRVFLRWASCKVAVFHSAAR